MTKMIDADKLDKWLKGRIIASKNLGAVNAYERVRDELITDRFDLTPPVQPDTVKAGRYFIVGVRDEGFNLTSDEGEEVGYILININGRMEGHTSDLKEIEMLYGRVTRIPGEVITDEQ